MGKVPKSVRLPPGDVERVEQFMDDVGMDEADALRMLINDGLRANGYRRAVTDGGTTWLTNWLWNISARLAHITLILVFTYTVGALSGHAVITLPQTLVFGGSALGLALLAVVVVFATVPSYRARMKHQLSEVRS